jgi:hypothetical protein
MSPQPVAPAAERPAEAAAEQITHVPVVEAKPKRHWGRPSARLVRRTLAAVVVIAVVAAGGLFWKAHQNAGTPQSVLRAALTNMLSTTSLQAIKKSGADQITTQFDFNSLANPTISTNGRVSFYGATFNVEGYGSMQRNYFKYDSLPNSVPAEDQVAIENSWLQWRDRGTATAGVTAILQQLSDPRYQIVGPAVFGNFSPDTAKKLVNYMLDNHVYKYSAGSVQKTQIDGQKVWVYPVTLNLSYLKIANQSAASSEAIAPNDVQAAIDALDQYKGQSATLAINPSTKQLVRFTAGQVTIDYSGYNHTSLPSEPVTNITWAKFQAVQLEVESAAASRETADQIDARRKNDFTELQHYFATYFQQNGFYPLLVNLNDQPWIATNLPGLDPDSLHEPLARDMVVMGAPAAGHYAYVPTDDAGASTCNNTLNDPCVHYLLTAILSDGQPYTVSDLTNAP